MDTDLQSIQEVRDALHAAHEAQQQFRSFSQEQVDRICAAMAAAGASQAARLGRMATEETGFGKPEDKEKKNLFATQRVWESIAALKTVGVILRGHRTPGPAHRRTDGDRCSPDPVDESRPPR